MIYQPMPIGRVCRECGVWKPRAQLVKHKGIRDGIESFCNSCNQAKASAYYIEHHDEMLQKGRQRRVDFGDEVRAAERRRHSTPEGKIKKKQKDKRYRDTHQEQLREKKRDEVKRHSDKANARTRRYQQRHPEKQRESLLNYRARKASLPNNFTTDDYCFMMDYWHGCCAICGRPAGLWHTIARDHWIPLRPEYVLEQPNPGTVPWNILPLCHAQKGGANGCNNSKNDSDPVKWLMKKLGPKKGKAKLAEINAFFAIVRR